MKKLALAVGALCLTGCSLVSLQDALALLTSLADKTGQVENWKATVVGQQIPDDPAPFYQRSAEDRKVDELGLETVMARLPDGALYPVICPAVMTKRCQSFVDGTKIYVNKGQIVECNVYRDGVLYGTCVAASELRQEM